MQKCIANCDAIPGKLFPDMYAFIAHIRIPVAPLTPNSYFIIQIGNIFSLLFGKININVLHYEFKLKTFLFPIFH